MKKMILFGVGALLLLVAAFIGYTVLVGNKRSPRDTAEFNQDGLAVKVVYCRPYKKGRLIFGEKAAGALVPYDTYWRLGANAATSITFGQSVRFAGQPVSAGTYRMYAIPGASTWKVVLNSELDRWGAREPSHDKDVVTVEVPVTVAPSSTEQFTIQIASQSSGAPGGASLDLGWDTTLVRVPLAAN